MRRYASAFFVIGIISLLVFWWASEPTSTNEASIEMPIANEGTMQRGEQVFWASGCASCHAADDAKGSDRLKLGGGHRLASPFGTFIAPNVSPDPETGIGNWSFIQFVNAMRHGTSPDHKHYYPAFPYASYALMSPQDQGALFLYLKSLPAVSRVNEEHELPVIFQWRRVLGIWKRLFAKSSWAVEVDNADETLLRGRYLVEVLGHCGECHTPRNMLGGTRVSQWLGGGPSPDGKGRVPNITPHEDGIGGWSEKDIAYYLESGFTPEYDSAGGSMASVVENFSNLTESDRLAVARYLKSVPPVASR